MSEHTDQPECPELQNLFLALIEADFANSERLLQEHLNSCPQCQGQTEIHELLQTWGRLGLLPEREPSADFMLRLKQRMQLEEIAQAERQRFWNKLNSWFEWGKIPALAGVLYLIFTLQLQSQLGQPSAKSLLSQAQLQRAMQQNIASSAFELSKIYRTYLKQRRQG